jgi:hypothetical protein
MGEVMRELTGKELNAVAGGDALGDTMIDIGEDMQRWSRPVAVLPSYGKVAGPLMYSVGTALIKQGEKRNQSTGIGGGISPPGGGPGGGGQPPGGGSGGGGIGGGGGGGGGDLPTVCKDTSGGYECHPINPF